MSSSTALKHKQGGKRAGAGRKSTGIKTKTMRVPSMYERAVKTYIKRLEAFRQKDRDDMTFDDHVVGYDEKTNTTKMMSISFTISNNRSD